ncbi:mce-related protein [Salmonella enterica subsp. enterica]|uniref:Mce-related protein n=1 Tax=Salmonella enterica I TaxID=59201 RepID=A0A3S4HZG5_SALET|nr:mce-related protein [Salmonella enterica subsp. enterica]
MSQGRGAARRDFELQEATITDSRYLDGLSIVVEAPEAGSLNIGTPVLFRGIEVGNRHRNVPGVALRSGDDHLAYQ